MRFTLMLLLLLGGSYSSAQTNNNVVNWAGGNTQAVEPALKPSFALWTFGDSFAACWGATNPAATCWSSILAQNTPAPTYTNGTAGAVAPLIAGNDFSTFAPDPINPSTSVLNSGANDGAHDSCGGTTTSGCAYNYQFSVDAMLAWNTIPYNYRILASNATKTGTWAADATLPIFTSTILSSNGTPEYSATSGSTLTFSIPSSASTKIGITYLITNAQTGTFTVSIDGTLVADASTGSTTFSSGGANGVAIYAPSSTFFRQEYAVTPGSAHTVVVTNTSANRIDVTSVDWIPPTTNTNTNVAFFFGPNAYYQYASTYDGMASALVASEFAAGLPVYYVSQINGNPGVNATTDLSTTATTSTPASTASGHPNDAGQLHLYQTIQNAEISSGYQFSYSRVNTAAANPMMQGPPTFYTTTVSGTTPSLLTSFTNANSNRTSPSGVDVYRNVPNGYRMGYGYINDVSTGLPWSGGYNLMMYNSMSGGYTCISALATVTSINVPATSYTCKFGVANATGASYQLGPASLPSVIPNVLYSAAGTALPACAVGIKGEQATVSDATTPTYMGAYASGGAITAAVICSYNGTTYSWLTH